MARILFPRSNKSADVISFERPNLYLRSAIVKKVILRTPTQAEETGGLAGMLSQCRDVGLGGKAVISLPQ